MKRREICGKTQIHAAPAPLFCHVWGVADLLLDRARPPAMPRIPARHPEMLLDRGAAARGILLAAGLSLIFWAALVALLAAW